MREGGREEGTRAEGEAVDLMRPPTSLFNDSKWPGPLLLL